MKMIACCDKNWGIGKNNELLVSIPQDMKFFRTMTSGHVVVMGRKTLESFPNQKPLPNRTNIVLTKNPNYQVKGAVVVHSDEELDAELAKYDSDDIFVIGGGSIYKKMEKRCDTAYITRLEIDYDADTYFPDLDQDPDWVLSEEGEEETYFDVVYEFDTYTRK